MQPGNPQELEDYVWEAERLLGLTLVSACTLDNSDVRSIVQANWNTQLQPQSKTWLLIMNCLVRRRETVEHIQIDCMVFKTAFNSISVLSQRPVHLPMLSWSSFNRVSAQSSFQATGYFPT